MHLALDDTIFLNLEGTAEVDRTPADFPTNSGAQIYVHHREVSYRHAAKARQGGLWVACVASVSIPCAKTRLFLFCSRSSFHALTRAETQAYETDQVS